MEKELKGKKLYDFLSYYYESDEMTKESGVLPSKKKLVYLKNMGWRKLCKEKGKFLDTLNCSDVIIFGCYSPSGAYSVYWDVIDGLDNFPYITTYMGEIGLAKYHDKKAKNEFLKYLKECDFRFGGYVSMEMKNIDVKLKKLEEQNNKTKEL